MIACIISTLASGQFLKDSIYTLKLGRRGINIRSGKEVNVLKSIPVKDVMNPNPETMPENLRLGQMTEKIIKSKYNSFPIVGEGDHLTGILSFRDYRDSAFDENLKDLVVAKDLATPDVITISQDDNLYDALEKITLKDFAVLPVVSPDDPLKLVGILTRRDIIGAYNKAVTKKSLFEKT
jgi:CIC family chloride channel protein